MKQIILSASLIATFMLYAVYARQSTDMGYIATTVGSLPAVSQTVPVPSSGTAGGDIGISTPTPAPTATPVSQPKKTTTQPAPAPKPAPAPAPAPVVTAPRGMYRDGEYTGSVVDVYYGNVEVKAIIKNGKLADVQFLQYPNDRRTSQYINSQAMPMLISEAIQAQGAQVDTVSGATATSGGFVQSLGDALSQAKA